jgi:hypothetical protein
MTFRTCLLTIGFSLVSGSYSLCSADINIPVVNANFLTLPPGGLTIAYGGPGYGYFSEAGIPGWTNAGVSGQYTPDPAYLSDIFNYIPGGGSTIGYSNGPTISQVVGTTVQVGDVYTLGVYIGNRNDPCCGPTGGANLMVNGVAYDATGTLPANGDWSLYTATYTGLAADAGDSITIDLTDVGNQGDFDLVSLSYTTPVAALPEPGYYALLAAGLAALLCFARMRQAKRRQSS